MAERRQEVEDIYRSRRFAYSKWELAARSRLYQAVGNMMATAEVREAVARAVGLAAAGGTPALGSVSDYFITAYDQGDFLSTHSDGASGSLAWVLHLAKGAWDGGALRFNAGRAAPTQDFSPAFNRMLLFLTRPDHTPHQVLPVRRASGPRFGLTGWYMTSTDKVDEWFLRENALMQAASSKASGDACV